LESAKAQLKITLHLENRMSQNTSQKPLQRILIILSCIAFAGSTVIATAGLFISAFQEPKDTPKTATAKTTAAQEEQLKAQASGYETVLQREPENQAALQGLVQIRLQMKDFQGAIAPMEKLVKLNPGNAEYKALLAGIKERAGQKAK
jgi:cytochrome c-type biogenesis protein CcmH/NrfG